MSNLKFSELTESSKLNAISQIKEHIHNRATELFNDYATTTFSELNKSLAELCNVDPSTTFFNVQIHNRVVVIMFEEDKLPAEIRNLYGQESVPFITQIVEATKSCSIVNEINTAAETELNNTNPWFKWLFIRIAYNLSCYATAFLNNITHSPQYIIDYANSKPSSDHYFIEHDFLDKEFMFNEDGSLA